MKTKDNAVFHIIQVQGWIEKDDKYLLAQRSMNELQEPGAWSLPGGKVENLIENNILENTLRKEIKEEIDIEVTDKMTLVSNSSFVRVDDAHVVIMTFLCHYQSGEAKAADDTSEIRWYTIEELLDGKKFEPWLTREIQNLKKRWLSERV